MNYSKIYTALIDKARTRISEGYVEIHHILPKCLGGSNDPENLVKLRPEEHYVAHQLLVKIYPNEPKLVFAAMAMCRGRSTNKLYGWLRRKYAEEVSKNQTGEMNSQFGKIWITDGITSKLIKKLDTIPEKWYTGRVINKLKGKASPNKGLKASDETRKKLSLAHMGIPKSEEQKKKLCKNYIVVDPNGIEYEVLGMRPFCIQQGLDHSAMFQVLSGKNKSHKGWTCRENIAR